MLNSSKINRFFFNLFFQFQVIILKIYHYILLLATKLNEKKKKKKKTLKILMKIDNYDYYSKIFMLCLYMEYILELDINYDCFLYMK
jgi:hypothetical protein